MTKKVSCDNCERIAKDANDRWFHQLDQIDELQAELDSRFKFTPLWLITGLFILILVLCGVAVKSFEYGAISVATGKLHCVTKDHNTMCEEVKK